MRSGGVSFISNLPPIFLSCLASGSFFLGGFLSRVLANFFLMHFESLYLDVRRKADVVGKEVPQGLSWVLR